jgi:hypothetical protein
MRPAAAAAASFALLLGCGAADANKSERDDDGSDLIEVNALVNLCPRFEASFILPQAIPRDASAFVAVRAADPDGAGRKVQLEWSATSGEFTDPELPITQYRCDELGAQQLTATVTDRSGCDTSLHIDVTCLSE